LISKKMMNTRTCPHLAFSYEAVLLQKNSLGTTLYNKKMGQVKRIAQVKKIF